MGRTPSLDDWNTFYNVESSNKLRSLVTRAVSHYNRIILFNGLLLSNGAIAVTSRSSRIASPQQQMAADVPPCFESRCHVFSTVGDGRKRLPGEARRCSFPCLPFQTVAPSRSGGHPSDGRVPWSARLWAEWCVHRGGEGATAVVSPDRPGSATSARERAPLASTHARPPRAVVFPWPPIRLGSVRFKRALVILALGGQPVQRGWR